MATCRCAYGGALQLSEQHKNKLTGIDLADSVTIDFHKLFYQPISCGAFLVKDQESFQYLSLHADYLNPEEDDEAGIPNLVNKSIQTTRRFDAFKLYVSLQAIGIQTFAEMVEGTMSLAKDVATRLKEEHFEVVNPDPQINAVVFRYVSNGENIDLINASIRDQLLNEGIAVIARTKICGQTYLKLTLLNPLTTMEDINFIIEQMKKITQETMKEEIYV
ncbi:pyridoxal-dependent decarboxylase [Bacillus carboniphilus]|uniref:Pyridoxal-dependent decarboxylase n=1 Tax=Bacillus carboniphilus TaxID=86663 RepID=A0ABY9JUR5_9BACI|nr:pyridoxal-dependent decarboxylase [Bacillus carboniphilus]WLR43135.1 pyridoxal-dependent decarboxylase [Bacillus carboniphilus]